jgi:uncharacterized membrane protein YhaH (DUF805 family)
MQLLTFTKLYLKNIFDFKGRASRWEYWGGNFLGGGLIIFVSAFIWIYFNSALFDFIMSVLFLYLIFAAFSCTVRRLHDVGKSGWNILWAITYVGVFYLLYLYVQPSEQKNNQWGEVPIHTKSQLTPEINQNEIIDEEEQDTPF